MNQNFINWELIPPAFLTLFVFGLMGLAVGYSIYFLYNHSER